MNDLVNRLRGIYTIPVNDGAGPLDGKNTFTRTFDNLPPIMGEAADAIERLQRERDNLYRCVQWYADGNHADLPDWEPPDEPNWLCPPTEIEGEELMPPGSWTPDAPPPKRHTVHISPSWLVEDGSIARAVLNGAPFPADFNDSEDPISAKGCTPLAPPVEPSKEPSK